jgi:Phosphatidylethanolamine-binding protein
VPFELQSPDFTAGSTIPFEFTCVDEDISPALLWTVAPAQTQSFALIADDPDTPVGTWVHWVLYNLPAGAQALLQNFAKPEKSHHGTFQGRNDFGKISYGDPCLRAKPIATFLRSMRSTPTSPRTPTLPKKISSAPCSPTSWPRQKPWPASVASLCLLAWRPVSLHRDSYLLCLPAALELGDGRISTAGEGEGTC